jgi:prepilin-type N-terminal cleavage/methylation domain-containing protein
MYKALLKSGFTIVELLVVTLVIGILSSIVYVSYENYEKRAESAQIGTTIRSYVDAVRGGVSFEEGLTQTETMYYEYSINSRAACLSSNTKRCCFYLSVSSLNPTLAPRYNTICGTNQEFINASLQTSNEAYTNVVKQLDEKVPTLPPYTKYGNLPSCETTGYIYSPGFNLPCYTNEIAYILNITQEEGGVPLAINKGVLVYYLPSDHTDCHHSDILTYISGFVFRYSGALYTQRSTSGTSQYTMCMVGIR